jgi:hypothetical protein
MPFTLHDGFVSFQFHRRFSGVASIVDVLFRLSDGLFVTLPVFLTIPFMSILQTRMLYNDGFSS